MKNKGFFSRHWSESDERVLKYLGDFFKDPPIKPDYKAGYDVTVGDAKIEIKSCQEWIHSESVKGKWKRRRGRFHFDKGTEADMILFVLVKESGELEFAIRFPEQYGVRKLKIPITILWNKVFTEARI
ncbi:MAG: hypothetical protein US68_C0021G0008 [Candidatus Shapirobacteria bacterium GW2011_GWE1_38_10]|uniref:Uncharacterized protein n=1 Tax=Candidatus Shapirobacteria bacterium GW2011_GWE1_38_10 TaxID=1618488 RepID=A0A0G0I327_9BACT|nr:MAG: hypothetical protein US68_C0021G0008 [Candidatus Shapirobacteria bacterium GW2011_GWE1_38_10]